MIRYSGDGGGNSSGRQGEASKSEVVHNFTHRMYSTTISMWSSESVAIEGLSGCVRPLSAM